MDKSDVCATLIARLEDLAEWNEIPYSLTITQTAAGQTYSITYQDHELTRADTPANLLTEINKLGLWR